ncbi:hypothetical protein ACFQ0M_08440 [Kitasatospora aburaviensis]
MAQQAASATGGRSALAKIVFALGLVLFVQALLALCLVSAQQLLVPRNMPFGVAGPPSPVVAEVASRVGLALTSYEDQSAATAAADRGELYGAYVSGGSADTLIVVPSKSFFAQTELEPAFVAAAHKLDRPLTVQTVKPLAPTDPVGAVTSLLLLPLLIGGYLAAVLVYKAAHGVAAAPWRGAILVGYALVGALLTDLIAGLGIGAYSSSHFWSLLPCFWLITSAVALAAAGLQAMVGRMGTLIVALLFIVIGGPPAGVGHVPASGVLAQHRGDLPGAERSQPDQSRALLRRERHLHPTDRAVPLRIRRNGRHRLVRPYPPARAAARRRRGERRHRTDGPRGGSPDRRRAMIGILAALGICAVMQCLFATNYMSASHAPRPPTCRSARSAPRPSWPRPSRTSP